MSLINYNKKYTCPSSTSSSCVLYDEAPNDILNLDTLPCDPSIGDVVLYLSTLIKDIKSQIDLSTYEETCLDFDKNSQKLKDLLQEFDTAICQFQEIIETVQSDIEDIQNGNISLTMDLGCLSSEISNCETPPKFSLLSILELFRDQICLLKS